MQVVLEPLERNRNVDAASWYRQMLTPNRSMAGSGRYTLPYDDEDRTAPLYQIFGLIIDNNLDLTQLCRTVFGISSFQEMASVLNNELVLKFTREIQYRIDEILEDSRESSELSRETMTVFNHHDNSINMSGTIQGSNVAISGSSVAGSNASYEVNQEVAAELEEIRRQLTQAGLSIDANQAALAAIEKLNHATSDPNITIEAVRESAGIAIASSPLAKSKLLGLVERIDINVASSVVAMGIKAALGM
jgi:hypothetical protein